MALIPGILDVKESLEQLREGSMILGIEGVKQDASTESHKYIQAVRHVDTYRSELWNYMRELAVEKMDTMKLRDGIKITQEIGLCVINNIAP